MQKIFLPISIVILGVCMLLSSWILANKLDAVAFQQTSKQLSAEQLMSLNYNKALMNSSEAAQYLGIEENEFNALINSQNNIKARLEVYDTYRFIPYIEIDKEKYFNVAEINKWIEHNMLNKY